MSSKNVNTHESSNNLNAVLEVIESHPYGLLGFMLAEDRAKQIGKLSQFHNGLNKIVNNRFISISDGEKESSRPYVTFKAITADPLKKGDSNRHRVFPVTSPIGILYKDRNNIVNGDYATLAILHYDNLVLDYYHNCPAELMATIRRDSSKIARRRGESFQCKADGTTVVLGSPTRF